MRKSWWVINLILLASAAGMAWKLRADWRQDLRQNGSQAIRPSVLPLPALPPAVSPRPYDNIAQQNPFSADRNDVIVTPQQAAAVPLGPPPLYYGSVIIGKQRFALLAEQPNVKPQRVNEGDTFAGYKLGAVHRESVVFQTAAGTSQLMLYNAIPRLERSSAKTAVTPSSAASTGEASNSTLASGASSMTVVGASAGAAPAESQPTTDAAHAGKHLMQTPFGPIWVTDKN
jgi:hypothetical protein